MRPLLVSLVLLSTGCSSLGQARRPTADDCAALDKARQRWGVVETVALGLGAAGGVATVTPLPENRDARVAVGLGAVGAAGVAAFAAHQKEVLTREYVTSCLDK